jgi:transposase-like protein
MKDQTKIAALPPMGPVDPEVPAKPSRRTFKAEYKLRILRELDQAGPGEIGLILRREGLYSSLVSDWRRALESGALSGLSQKRGRKPKERNPLDPKVRELERENRRLREQLRKAAVIIDVQGKLAGLLGLTPKDERS